MKETTLSTRSRSCESDDIVRSLAYFLLPAPILETGRKLQELHRVWPFEKPKLVQNHAAPSFRRRDLTLGWRGDLNGLCPFPLGMCLALSSCSETPFDDAAK